MDTGYSFHISDSYTPDSIPMERLAEYMAALARLLGESPSVHFKKVYDGSVALRAAVDEPARPKVHDRVQAVRSGTASEEARRAYADLDNMLRDDNAVGSLTGDGDTVVIPFPGKTRPKPVVYGPFRQDGSIEGQVYRIGGKDESKHVHIHAAKEDLSVLTASEEVAMRLRHHLFGGTLRFFGAGTWFRHGDGVWELKSFRIQDFIELDDTPLDEVVSKLRASGGGQLSSMINGAGRLIADRKGSGDAD